jgi:hypothetical protein
MEEQEATPWDRSITVNSDYPRKCWEPHEHFMLQVSAFQTLLTLLQIGVPFQAAIGVGCGVIVILFGTGFEARNGWFFVSVGRRNFRGKYSRRYSRMAPIAIKIQYVLWRIKINGAYISVAIGSDGSPENGRLHQTSFK